jgi:hypothetical protein
VGWGTGADRKRPAKKKNTKKAKRQKKNLERGLDRPGGGLPLHTLSLHLSDGFARLVFLSLFLRFVMADANLTVESGDASGRSKV